MVFQLIMHKILNIEQNNFFINDNTNTDPLFKMIFELGYNTIDKNNFPLYKKKFILLKEILNNFIIQNSREEEIINYFYKIQRVYNGLNRFLYIYKVKKSKLVVNTDMCLNEINENEKNVICIYQDNSRYLFKILDLLKIIDMSLIHSQNLFADPLCIKNPYNNLPFSKSILYYIYHFIIEKTNYFIKINYTELFFKFHSCNFCLTDFLNKFEHLIREKTIKNNIKNSTNNDTYNIIIQMINKFNMNKVKDKRILIDSTFPKDKLIKIFKPYLNLYLDSKYLLVSYLKYNAACELEKKLVNFQKFNPLFGRIKIKIINTKNFNQNNKIICVNDSHINFNQYDNDTFLNDHLTYKYIYYNTNNFNSIYREQDVSIQLNNTDNEENIFQPYENDTDYDDEENDDDIENDDEENDDEENDDEENDDEENDDEENVMNVDNELNNEFSNLSI
jgi:hypothetical protein